MKVAGAIDGDKMPSNRGYRPIADYALIGNTHTAALVSSEGSIDWCCLPHFDSPAVFLRLLDAERGGFWHIRPTGVFRSRREYVGESAILATTFTTTRGVVRLVDHMHAQDIIRSRIGVDIVHCHRIMRLVEGVEGDVELDVRLRPTFDYARASTDVRIDPGVAIAHGGDGGLLLQSPEGAAMSRTPDGALATTIRVRRGERAWFVLTSFPSHGPVPATADPEMLLRETEDHWRRWSSQCTYAGPYHSLVRTSARVLKLLTFGPTGALVAAPTTSIPEDIGGVRNWDYRYAWLRDSALILRALAALGYHEAAIDFFHWLERTTAREQESLQIMYALSGGRDLPEYALPLLDGYRGSRPVRVGNAASAQVQLDVYGYVLDAAWVCARELGPIRPALWSVLRRLADQAAARWREPDQGIWEVRAEPRHFLSSKLMCWVALDRAIRLASAGTGLACDRDCWRAERDAIRRAILDAGFDARLGAFTQALGSSTLDASALMMPLVGFLPATDPRMRSTIAAVSDRLSHDGLVYRYVAGDGVAGGEAAFALCTFWLVENFALLGQVERARALFERVTSYANDLGLMSEEIAPTGELLGNYPQGFTHLGLIHAALRIAAATRGDPRSTRSA